MVAELKSYLSEHTSLFASLSVLVFYFPSSSLKLGWAGHRVVAPI